MSNNIERFDEIAGQIFGELYMSFPKPKSLLYLELGGFAETDIDEYGGIPSEAEFCRDVACWLVDAGYIWSDSYDHLALSHARLTPKALEVLKMAPEVLNGSEPLGERIAGAFSEGSKEILKQLVGVALSEGTKLLLRG